MMKEFDLDKIMEVIDSVKMCSGSNEVVLIGCKKTFDELKSLGFPLEDFERREAEDDESRLFIVPKNERI